MTEWMPKIYVAENNVFTGRQVSAGYEKKRGKIRGQNHCKLMKTNIEKMSTFAFPRCV